MKSFNKISTIKDEAKNMVFEKVMKTGSPELRSKLPKGFLRIASEITDWSEFTIRAIVVGDRYDDTGFIDLVERIAKENQNFQNNMRSMLMEYKEQNRLK